MIFVDKASFPVPDILTDPKKDGPKETLKAIAHYTGPSKATTFNFKVYRDPEVKEALTKLFKNKCAYCESTFLHIYPGDIEHFRPKGEIEGVVPDSKPGYYWLAADWDNLLFSCRNCNQKLTHTLHGEADKRTMGKMNQFPLSDPSKYVRKHDHIGGVNTEENYRLLLNPCVDNPEKHLEYGKEGVIKPKKDALGKPSLKGETSIKVYVLHRVPLVQAREKILIDMQAQIQRVKEAFDNYNTYLSHSDTEKFYFEKILKRELDRLKKFINPEEPYVGMARQVVGKFLLDNFGITI